MELTEGTQIALRTALSALDLVGFRIADVLANIALEPAEIALFLERAVLEQRHAIELVMQARVAVEREL